MVDGPELLLGGLANLFIECRDNKSNTPPGKVVGCLVESFRELHEKFLVLLYVHLQNQVSQGSGTLISDRRFFDLRQALEERE